MSLRAKAFKKKCTFGFLMMESKVGKRGGRREGAGRKRKPTEVMYIRLSPDVARRVRDEAQSKGCSVGDVIEAYIRQ